jgi:hypothetical protein
VSERTSSAALYNSGSLGDYLGAAWLEMETLNCIAVEFAVNVKFEIINGVIWVMTIIIVF